MRIKKPDHKNALSIIEESERQMKFTLTLHVNESSGFTIVRNIYECFRMLGDALLVNRGTSTIDHVEPINTLLNLTVETRRPIRVIDNLRRMGHNINYYGYRPTLGETNDVVDIAKACFNPLTQVVRKEIEKN